MKLFEKELSMCKIEYKPNENKFEPKEGNGFFCQINLKENPSFPFKYCLFTNNHIINHSSFDNGIININYNKSINFIQKFLKQKESVPKELDHIDKRRFFTSKLLDYSCIEMFENEIKNIFNIDPFIFKEDKILCGEEIFILQYPKEKNISFSGGKITEVKESHFRYNASTEEGSSGSPIIRRLDITSLQESEY